MTTPLSILRVNGQQYNWNSTKTLILGVPVPGVIEVNYGEKLDVETVRSQTQDGVAIGSTGGEYSVEGFQIKMLAEHAAALFAMLAAVPPFIGSIGRTEFPFHLTASEPLLVGALPIVTDAPVCRIVGRRRSHAKGIEALVTEIDVWAQSLTENGVSLYAPQLPFGL